MGLGEIIAQRISAASQARARMDESNFSLAPLQEGLKTGAALALRRDAASLERQQYEDTQRGVPEPVARMIAPSVAPNASPEGMDAVVQAIGARGGANLLAKLAAYTAMDRHAQELSAAKLKEAKGFDAYIRVAKGGLDAAQPGDPVDAVARGADDYRAGQPEDNTALIDAYKAGGADVTGLAPTMGAADIRGVMSSRTTRAGLDYRKNKDAIDREIASRHHMGQAPVFQDGMLTGWQTTPEEERAKGVAERARSYLELAVGEKDRTKQRDSFGRSMAGLRLSWAAFRDPYTGMVDMNKWLANAPPAMRTLWDEVKAAAVTAGHDLHDLVPEVPVTATPKVNPITGGAPPPPPPADDTEGRKSELRQKIADGTSTEAEEAEFESLIKAR